MFPTKPRRGRKVPLITRAFGVVGPYLIGWHTGTDFGWTRTNRNGQPRERVRATCKGIIHTVVRGDHYYGNYVVIWHPAEQRWSWYCHLALIRSDVKVGASVHTGHWLGYMGASGNATGVHLHYEERIGLNRYSADDIRKPILTTKRRAPWALYAKGWR